MSAAWTVLLGMSMSLALQPADGGARPETAVYLRPARSGFARECTFQITSNETGWRIKSITQQGEGNMTVEAAYDKQHRLLSAQAVLTRGEVKQTAAVQVQNGKAQVMRAGEEPQEFEVPAGVIVTSAPDWTDTFVLCRRYDRQVGGKQSFTGLWIHPTQKAQLLPFTIEKTGTAMIEQEGRVQEVDRLTIRIRGPNPYVAWADSQGRMLRLIPLPYKEGTVTGLLREGYEQSTKALRPG